MTRILFLDHTPFVGGAQLVLADHIRHLDRTRFAPYVACTDTVPSLVERFREAGARVHLLPLPRLRGLSLGTLPALAGTMLELRRLVKRERIDLVVANTSRTAYIAAAALAGVRAPTLWWVRDFEYGHRWFRLLRGTARHVICVSEAIRRYYGGEGDPGFSVVHVGNDLYARLDDYTPECVRDARARWGFGPDDVVVGYMGRLVEGKGPEDLLSAFETLRARHPRLRLLVAGTGGGQEGDVEGALRERVERSGLAEVVRFAGYQSEEALFYQMFDLFVLSSRYAEALPTSAIQAMMAGKPVVATATGGTPELVLDGVTGLLVPPARPDAMAAAIERLLDDPELACRLAAAGREHAMAHHREEVITARVEAVYHRVLAEQHRG